MPTSGGCEKQNLWQMSTTPDSWLVQLEDGRQHPVGAVSSSGLISAVGIPRSFAEGPCEWAGEKRGMKWKREEKGNRGGQGGRMSGVLRNQAALYDSSGLSLSARSGPNAEGRWCSMPQGLLPSRFPGPGSLQPLPHTGPSQRSST